MPQPVNHKAAITQRTLTMEQFALIGSVAAEWAHVELGLALAASKFSGSDLTSQILIFSNMTAKSKIDTTGALSKLKLQDAIEIEFSALITKARRLSGIRNSLIHAIWHGIDAKGRMHCMTISALHDRADIAQTSWSTDEIKFAVSELQELFKELNIFLITHKLWSGVLFD